MTKPIAGAPRPKKSTKPVKVLSKSIAEMVDPEVRRVHAARMQVHEMQKRLDAVLQLAFPEWDNDKHIYVAGVGFFKKTDKPPRSDDPAGAPVKRYGRKNG